MRNLRTKRSIREILETKPFLFILAVLILFSGWNLLDFWGKMKETEEKKQIAEQKFNELMENKYQINSDLEKLNSERGIEGVLREDYGLAKEGEGLIVVVEEEEKSEKEDANKGFWGFWRSIFK